MPKSTTVSRFAQRFGAALAVGVLWTALVAAQTSTPSAYVYVQTSSGVIAYRAAANGALTKISGSPFKTSGLQAGSTGIAFYSVGTHYIHVYKVASNGAIGSQISQINTQLYPGGSCGPSTAGQPGVLDHSGKYFYNFLSTLGTCSVYQTYSIGSTGALRFNNYTSINTANSGPNTDETTQILAVLGNETYAYGIESSGHASGVIGFKRETSGALQHMPINVVDPSGVPYAPRALAADSTNHVAALTLPNAENPAQLVSYTADTNGNLISTNTSTNAPYVDLSPSNIAMSSSGLLLAVGGDASSYAPTTQSGLELFHFNGANPLTKYKVVFRGTPIDYVKWDKSNHLYAASSSAHKLYVYTVAPTSVTAAPGSPYSLGTAPMALFVKSLH